ncbi:HAUS augmin-like complex subunit 3 [Rhinophrynus dorsalis]
MMLSRQRSSCLILDPPHIHGSDFVDLLRLIDYPGAGNLKGEDFDWLCEGNEEAELFIGWLCGMVDQRNILSEEQLEAYSALLASGQPLLEVDELQSLYGGGGGYKGDQEQEDMKSMEELEAEVQSLRNLKSHRLHSRNKLESLGLVLLRNHLSLERWEKEEEKILSNTKEGLAMLNSRCNSAFAKLRDITTELGELHSAQTSPAIFLSLLDLEAYMRLEETCWRQVEECAMCMLPIKEEEVELERRAQREMSEDVERMRTAWASQRIQMSLALGTLHGKENVLNWLNGNQDEQWDPLQLPSLEREVQNLEAEVEVMQTQRLPALVCEASLGPCLPAHQEWLQVEHQKLMRAEQCQAPVAEALIHQLSRLQLVEMGLLAEMREHRQTEMALRGLKMEMVNRASDLGRRTLGPQEMRLPSQWLTPIRIDSRDKTAVRLSLMLEEPTNQKELFPKYEALQRRGASLVQELMSLSSRLHGPLPQTSSLEQSCEEMLHSLCRGTSNVQLQDQTLTLSFEALSACVSHFNQWCLDCLRDLQRKKLSIQTSRRDKERQLYVLFFQDPALLTSTVQDLEKRVAELQSSEY